MDLADEKVGNVDGSPWIRNQVQRQSLPLDALGLDFYHLGENVHKARREIYGDDDEAGKRVGRRRCCTCFKHEGYEAAWQAVAGVASRPAAGQAEGGGPAGELRQRAARDDQAIRSFVAKGWQIGSGPDGGDVQDADGAAEGLGDALGRDNAEALMALEALTQSGQWDLYWQTQLRPTG